MGWIDPTPICDGTNAGISLARGNELEAGLNAVAIIPAVGDIIGKGGKGALKASSDVVGSADGFLNNAVEGIGKNLDEGLDGAADASKRVRRARPGSDLPSRGEPNTSSAVDYGDGEGTIRDYGSDGVAETDYDFGHDHTGAGDPHAHDWQKEPGGKRTRGEPRPLGEGE